MPPTDRITLQIDIAAPPASVFRALTTPDELLRWWGPVAHCITNTWEFDLRRGGRWAAQGHDDTCGDWTVTGEIVEYDPPRVLACTWNESLERARPLGTTLVRYELEAIDSGTRLTLVHSGFGEHEAVRAEYANGWPGIFASLQAHLDARRAVSAGLA